MLAQRLHNDPLAELGQFTVVIEIKDMLGPHFSTDGLVHVDGGGVRNDVLPFPVVADFGFLNLSAKIRMVLGRAERFLSAVEFIVNKQHVPLQGRILVDGGHPEALAEGRLADVRQINEGDRPLLHVVADIAPLGRGNRNRGRQGRHRKNQFLHKKTPNVCFHHIVLTAENRLEKTHGRKQPPPTNLGCTKARDENDLDPETWTAK